MPRAFASLLRAITHPSLFDKMTTGLPFSDGQNTRSQEAYKLCKNDLRERAKNETELLINANENAKSAIEALIKPWIESVDREFQIEFK